MTEVEIEYCVPCQLLEPAQGIQRSLLETFGDDLDGVRLLPGDGGVFEVRLDGETVFDGQEETYEDGLLVEKVRSHLVEAPA